MRIWYKYIIGYRKNAIDSANIDSSFSDHARGMGNYDPDGAYSGKKEFFRKYYYGFHYGRLQRYDDFMRRRLALPWRIFSIASGRCANELMLMEDGYDITCSDLEKIPALAVTQKLFPGLRFNCLDILKSCASGHYDAVLALSLIYLFSENELNTFFRNCSDSLRPGGCLILDSAGAPDNLPAFLWHDVCLRIESYIVRVLIWLRRGQLPSLTRKHFGYRRTSAEIISAARAAGFELVYQKDYVTSSEFRRSVFFNLLVRQGGLIDKVFVFFGKSFPYTRMFDFRKLK